MLKRMDDSEGEPRGFSRRTFLVTGAAAGGGLLLGVYLPRTIGAKAQVSDETFAPNAFVRIKRDDSITLVMPQVEMGQGTYTSMSMLIAEELEVDLAKVTPEAAPPSDKLYGLPLLGFQVTGGSTSVMGFWEPLRRVGATARIMLIEAAAAAVECRSYLMSRRKGRGNLADGPKDQLRSTRRRGGKTVRSRQGRPQGPQRFYPDRNACQTYRYTRQGERQGQVRHRRDDTGHEVRDGCRMSRFWRQTQERRRQRDAWRSRRAPEWCKSKMLLP